MDGMKKGGVNDPPLTTRPPTPQTAQDLDAALDRELALKEVMARIGQILDIQSEETHVEAARRVVDSAASLLDRLRRVERKHTELMDLVCAAVTYGDYYGVMDDIKDWWEKELAGHDQKA